MLIGIQYELYSFVLLKLMNMKFSIFLISIYLLAATVVDAGRTNYDVPNDIIVNSRFETINEHAFFILDLKEAGIDINYGDKVDLVFGLNNVITVYNISGINNEKFINKNELVAFIAPEYLRCFKNKNLRKVIIYTEDKFVKIKINIPANQLKIK